MKKETKDFIIDQLEAAAIVLVAMFIGWAVTVSGLWLLGVL